MGDRRLSGASAKTAGSVGPGAEGVVVGLFDRFRRERPDAVSPQELAGESTQVTFSTGPDGTLVGGPGEFEGVDLREFVRRAETEWRLQREHVWSAAVVAAAEFTPAHVPLLDRALVIHLGELCQLATDWPATRVVPLMVNRFGTSISTAVAWHSRGLRAVPTGSKRWRTHVAAGVRQCASLSNPPVGLGSLVGEPLTEAWMSGLSSADPLTVTSMVGQCFEGLLVAQVLPAHDVEEFAEVMNAAAESWGGVCEDPFLL